MWAVAVAAQVNPGARASPARPSSARRAGSSSSPVSAAAMEVCVGLAVGHRVPADLGQRQVPGGQGRRATGHCFEHRQPESLSEARIGDHGSPTEQARQLLQRQVTGLQQPQPGRDLSDGGVQRCVPTGPACHHQRRWVGPSGAGRDPAPDQGRNVLARLQCAEKRDVILIRAQPRRLPARRPPSFRRRPEELGVHAQMGDLQPIRPRPEPGL